MKRRNKGMKKRSLVLGLLAVACLPQMASANLKIVTTTQDLAAIASAVGGNNVKVSSIVVGARDPHRIEAKPSYMSKVAGADMFAAIGLELEIAYEGAILSGSSNGKVQIGAPGHFYASDFAYILEKPSGHVTRAQGDVHPYGNPHIWLDPYNGRAIAIAMAEKMGKLDPSNKEEYRQNMVKFVNRLDAEMFGDALFKKYGGPKLWDWQRAGDLKEKLQADGTLGQLGGWAGQMLPLAGTPIVTYHKTWVYFARRFGLDIVDELEPKPGLEPTPGHLVQVIKTAKERGVKIILEEPYYSRRHADTVGARVGAKVLIVPNNVGQGAAKDYFALFDTIIAAIKSAR
jgi:zinc/manganese transport system substrate-binding protein